MSEVINLIKDNPDSHVYSKAANILSQSLQEDYSFVIQVWDHEMPQDTKHKKILISTSDEAHKVPSQVDDSGFAHIFKQYAPMADANNPSSIQEIRGVTPIPLCHLEGVKNNGIPILEREYDWSWMGQYDPYRRVEFKMAVDELSLDTTLVNKVVWYEGWNNGEPIETYSNDINNTKIMLIPRGSGSLESFRFFEAMMCGCIIVTIAQPVIDFYNVAPCVKIASWDNLSQLLRDILKQSEEIQFLSEQAQHWYKCYCSPEGLAAYMYKAIKRKNPDV